MNQYSKNVLSIPFLALLLSGVLQLPLSKSVNAGIMDDLVRDAARVGKNVPVDSVDNVARQIHRAEIPESSHWRRIDEAKSFKPSHASFGGPSTQAIGAAFEGIDPKLQAAVLQMDSGAQAAAETFANGGRRIADTIPDLAERSRFVADAGPETIAAVGIYGEEALRSAAKVHAAVDSGLLVAPAGVRAAKTSDFGSMLLSLGDRGWKFWNKRVIPHWKSWLAGGVLTAFLVAPDQFIDAAGDLSEYASRRITELAGSIAAGIIRGGGEEVGNAMIRPITTAVPSASRYLPSPMTLAVSAAALIIALMFLSRRRRRQSTQAWPAPPAFPFDPQHRTTWPQ